MSRSGATSARAVSSLFPCEIEKLSILSARPETALCATVTAATAGPHLLTKSATAGPRSRATSLTSLIGLLVLSARFPASSKLSPTSSTASSTPSEPALALSRVLSIRFFSESMSSKRSSIDAEPASWASTAASPSLWKASSRSPTWSTASEPTSASSFSLSVVISTASESARSTPASSESARILKTRSGMTKPGASCYRPGAMRPGRSRCSALPTPLRPGTSRRWTRDT